MLFFQKNSPSFYYWHARLNNNNKFRDKSELLNKYEVILVQLKLKQNFNNTKGNTTTLSQSQYYYNNNNNINNKFNKIISIKKKKKILNYNTKNQSAFPTHTLRWKLKHSQPKPTSTNPTERITSPKPQRKKSKSK